MTYQDGDLDLINARGTCVVCGSDDVLGGDPAGFRWYCGRSCKARRHRNPALPAVAFAWLQSDLARADQVEAAGRIRVAEAIRVRRRLLARGDVDDQTKRNLRNVDADRNPDAILSYAEGVLGPLRGIRYRGVAE